MHLYRFFNPSAEGADSCVIFVSAKIEEAIIAYVGRYFPDSHGIALSEDFNHDNCILMEASFEKLEDGKVVFYELFAFEIL